jgi:hypothetical protein
MLVHEAAHCLQQRGSSHPPYGSTPARVDRRADLESEANEAASAFRNGLASFRIRPRRFDSGSPIIQCIETATLRAWLGAAEYDQLKVALGASNFAALIGVNQQTLERFQPGGGRTPAACRAALQTYFGRFPGITAQQAGDLLIALPGLNGPQCADFVNGLPGLNYLQVHQFAQTFPPGGIGQLARLITRLAPHTGIQITTLVQNLMNQRVFTLLHIYSIVEILGTNGVQTLNFFTKYTLVNGQPMANVVRELHFGAPPLTGAQIYDVVDAVGGLPGIAGGFTINGVLRNLPGPVGPVRMHSLSQLNARILTRLERMLNGDITAPELEAALGVAPLDNNQHLNGFLQALVDANLQSNEMAYLIKVMSNQIAPVMPADTLAKKVALFLRYHCGQRASDIPVGDDTTVEQTTQNNPRIETNRGGWTACTKVHIRLSRRGLNHFKRRHFLAHFDFDDIKPQNTFFPHGANIQDQLVFQVSCATIDAMNAGLNATRIAGGFVTHNVTLGNLSYRVGVNWTATPAATPAQPIARFDQFFITNGPPLEVIQIPEAEMNTIETILIAAQKIA